MDANVLKEYISSAEHAEIVKEAITLKEDVMFFNMSIKRLKQSDFNFELIPFKKGSRRFCSQLWEKYSVFYGRQEPFVVMLTEIAVVEKLVKHLMEGRPNVMFSDDNIREIYKYFKTQHNMALEDYLSDFIGSGNVSRQALDRLSAAILNAATTS